MSQEYNTAYGQNALKNCEDLTSGNSAFGAYTLANESDPGKYNTAVGLYSLYFTNEGVCNTAVGAYSLHQNTSGKFNVALGNDALNNNENGSYNTAIGYKSISQSSIDYTTAVGAQSVVKGNHSIAIGYKSTVNDKLDKNETKEDVYGSTAIGVYTQVTAKNSTVLGYSAKSEYENSTAIGAESKTTTENQIRLGKSGTSVYLDDIQLTSDKRDKTDIKESSLGLDFILGLNPVEYKWDRRDAYKDNKSDGSKKDKRVHHGFIAQDFQDLDFDFGGFQDHKLNGGEDQLSLNYLEFIAPLTKAIQEQQKIIERQQREIELLKKNI